MSPKIMIRSQPRQGFRNQPVSDRPRILVIEGARNSAGDLLEQADFDVVRVENLASGLPLLRSEHFDGVYADTRDSSVRQWAGNLLQSERILESLSDGISVVNADLKIVWANSTFEKWCGGPVRHRGFYEALGAPEILGPDYSPFHTALTGTSTSTRLHTRDNRFLQLRITPLIENDKDSIRQFICLARDATSEVQQQQKLDALHQAGLELAALTPDQLAEMTVEERIELLKLNIRRFLHDLLHYDVIEIRLLDRKTGKLEPLLSEGMTPAAATRELRPHLTDYGVTGFVAATGKSYLCPDTANDPLYLEGASGARSSLTVPLIVYDQVIGTFNVESPKLNAFGDEDLQFAEIFSREIAACLHTFELLSAEKRGAASQSIDAISRAVALPVDEILLAATAVLDRYIGHDEEMAAKLHDILSAARAIKESIQKVGEDLDCAPSKNEEWHAHPKLHGLRVLVVDSDERVRRSAHAILGRYGCIVETARDGHEGVAIAKISKYDAMLADIRLPDMDGYEIFRQLQKAQPNARVILMTSYGYDPAHGIVKARQEGLKAVLFKPFRIDQLLDALEKPLDSPSCQTVPQSDNVSTIPR
ncbi:MAG: two-component system response regulator [Gemmatales bacterium]|nr:MAG: two-component system response regulator [Gemmatales bacterium]